MKLIISLLYILESRRNVVRLGEHEIGSRKYGPHEDVTILRFITHKDFDHFLWINDIGMIHLERDVEFTGFNWKEKFVFFFLQNFFTFFVICTDRISPICLPIFDELRDRSYVGTTPFIAGWGLTKDYLTKEEEENVLSSDILLQVQVPVIENSKCKENYRAKGELFNDIQFSDRVLCAGFENGGGDSCDGDSGGKKINIR